MVEMGHTVSECARKGKVFLRMAFEYNRGQPIKNKYIYTNSCIYESELSSYNNSLHLLITRVFHDTCPNFMRSYSSKTF